jgi:hypothetical protein
MGFGAHASMFQALMKCSKKQEALPKRENRRFAPPSFIFHARCYSDFLVSRDYACFV